MVAHLEHPRHQPGTPGARQSVLSRQERGQVHRGVCLGHSHRRQPHRCFRGCHPRRREWFPGGRHRRVGGEIGAVIGRSFTAPPDGRGSPDRRAGALYACGARSRACEDAGGHPGTLSPSAKSNDITRSQNDASRAELGLYRANARFRRSHHHHPHHEPVGEFWPPGQYLHSALPTAARQERPGNPRLCATPWAFPASPPAHG